MVHKAYSVRSTVFCKALPCVQLLDTGMQRLQRSLHGLLQSFAVWPVIWSTEWHAKPTAFAPRSLTKPCPVSGYLIMVYKSYSVRSTVFSKATPGGQLLVNGLAYKAYSVRSTVFGKVTPGDQLLDIVMAYKAYSIRSTVFLKSLAGCQVTWYRHAGNARKTVIWPVPDV